MKCKHYKGEGYTYRVEGQDINLCKECEMELLSEMKKQEVIENKMQVLANELFEKKIEKLESLLNEKVKEDGN